MGRVKFRSLLCDNQEEYLFFSILSQIFHFTLFFSYNQTSNSVPVWWNCLHSRNHVERRFPHVPLDLRMLRMLYVVKVAGRSPGGQWKSQHFSFYFIFQVFNRICRSIAKNIWQSSGFFCRELTRRVPWLANSFIKYHCWVSFPCFLWFSK